MELIMDNTDNGKERAMYRKKEVYLGLTEMSFEELRAQTWHKYRNAKTPVRAKMRDADDQLIVKPIKFGDDDDDNESFFEQPNADEPDDDLVCGILPDTPVMTSKKKSKFVIYGE